MVRMAGMFVALFGIAVLGALAARPSAGSSMMPEVVVNAYGPEYAVPAEMPEVLVSAEGPMLAASEVVAVADGPRMVVGEVRVTARRPANLVAEQGSRGQGRSL